MDFVLRRLSFTKRKTIALPHVCINSMDDLRSRSSINLAQHCERVSG